MGKVGAGLLSGLFGKIATKVGLSLITRKVREAAEGKLGAWPRRIYWRLAANKTAVGGIVGTAAAVLAMLGHTDVATGVLGVGAVMIQVGLMDKAWRTTVPESLQARGWYRFLVTHSADWAAIFGVVLGILSQQPPTDGRDLAMKIVGGLAVVLVQVGVLEPGWRSAPPRVPELFVLGEPSSARPTRGAVLGMEE